MNRYINWDFTLDFQSPICLYVCLSICLSSVYCLFPFPSRWGRRREVHGSLYTYRYTDYSFNWQSVHLSVCSSWGRSRYIDISMIFILSKLRYWFLGLCTDLYWSKLGYWFFVITRFLSWYDFALGRLMP